MKSQKCVQCGVKNTVSLFQNYQKYRTALSVLQYFFKKYWRYRY